MVDKETGTNYQQKLRTKIEDLFWRSSSNLLYGNNSLKTNVSVDQATVI